MRGLAIFMGSAALALAGCSDARQARAVVDRGGAPVEAAERLDCPEREDDLRLTSASPTGRSCAYRGKDGTEVELRLAASSDLPALEAELKALIPAAAAPLGAPAAWAPAAGTPAAAADLRPGRGERTEVRLPGLRVDSEGERATVRMPGMSVDAQGDAAKVRIGGDGGETVDVSAHAGGAVIRVSEAKARGDLRSRFLVVAEEPSPAGWRLVGYQARGAEAGRVVVGVVRSPQERHGRLMEDVEDLVDRNVIG